MIERRHYRIPSIVPIEFQLLSSGNDPLDAEVRTAFTRDLSEAGMGLVLRSLPKALIARIEDESTELAVQVDIELPKRTLRIPARVVWRQRQGDPSRPQYLLGLAFTQISEEDGAAIAAFAKRAARRPTVVRAAVAALGLLLLGAVGLYLWRTSAYERELAASHEALTQHEATVAGAKDKLADMQVEVRWLAVRTAELVDMMEAEKGANPTADPAMRPVVADLSENVEKLRALIVAHQKARSGETP